MHRRLSCSRRLAGVCAGLIGVVALTVAPLNASTPAPTPTLEQVGNKVYCLCGCVTLLNRCPHLPSECQSRAEMQTAILAGIHKGESEPAILQDLVRRYGVRVLASPPAAGFDLTAWVLPVIGFVIGLAIVLAIVRRWRAKVASGESHSDPAAADPHILAAVEEEMKTLKD